MTEEKFNQTIKDLDVVLLDVAKFIITLNKINERLILEEPCENE